MRHPLAAPALAFGLGILLARLTWFLTGELVACILFFSGLAIIGWFWGKDWLRWVSVVLAMTSLGALNAHLRPPRSPPSAALESGTLRGCVIEPSVHRGDRLQFTLEVSEGNRVRLTVPESVGSLAYGQRVELEAKVRPVHGFHNPGAFDVEEWFGRRRIYWTGGTGPKGVLRLLPDECGSAWSRTLEGLRARTLARIDSLYPDDNYHRAMMRGLLLGDKSEIRKTWIEDYRRTGTYHALVISGSHITLVCGLLLTFRRRFNYGVRTRLLIAALLASLYALLAGGDAPVMRAAAAFAIYAGFGLLYRRKAILNTLAAVMLIFLVLDPDQLFDASFQLSFLAVAALSAVMPQQGATFGRFLEVQALGAELLLVTETFRYVTGIRLRWADWIVNTVTPVVQTCLATLWLSLAVQVGLALPMAIYFHRLSLTGATANVLAVPMVSIAIPLGFVGVFTGLRLPAQAAGWLLDASRAVVGWHAAYEPSWRIPDPPLWLALLLTGALVVLAARWARGRWVVLPVVACAALLCVLVLHPFAPSTEPGTLEVTAIDVGQGESLFVALPGGKMGLVDGGGLPQFGRQQQDRMDIGEDVVSPYLWTRGIRRLDFIAVTHLHDDHAGGIAALMENFRPRELWTGFTPDNPIWRNLESKARALGISIRTLKQGNRLALGGAHWEVLAPAPDQAWRGRAQNNDSLVMRLRYGRHSFLLTGDVENGVQRRLLEEHPELHVDVLKVPHHGSRRSNLPAWLDTLQPSVAMISAGLGNSYGLPHQAVIDELQMRHATILRTDLDGLSTVRSDGRYFQIGSMRQHSVPSATEIWLRYGGD